MKIARAIAQFLTVGGALGLVGVFLAFVMQVAGGLAIQPSLANRLVSARTVLPQLHANDLDARRFAPPAGGNVVPPTEAALVLAQPPGPPVAEPRDEPTARVTSGVNLRSGPAKASERLTTLEAGEDVVVLGQEGRWMKVRTTNGTSGWVYEPYLNMASVAVAAQ